MHIREFLNSLGFCEHIEVIITCLPECPPHGPSHHRELQRLKSGREQIFAGFTQQQMDVFRHDNVADNLEPVAAAHLLQRILKLVPQQRTIQISKPVIATESDKMHVPFHLAPLQSQNHGGILQLTLTGETHSYYLPCIGT